MQKRTDGWTGRRTDRTHGPVQTNEVRCHVPAPCCWTMQAGSGRLRGERVVRRLWHLRRHDIAPAACWTSSCPETLSWFLCVLHHRRILETGKEVAGILGSLGREEGAASTSHGIPAPYLRRRAVRRPHLARSSSFCPQHPAHVPSTTACTDVPSYRTTKIVIILNLMR